MSHKLLSLGIAVGILIPNVVLAEQAAIEQGNSIVTTIAHNKYV